MKALIYALCGLAAAVGLALASPGHAQTANDINRLNAAIQICNSPMGAGQPECAKLRAQAPGMGGRAAALAGGMGGGKAAGLAGLLGSAISASRAAAPPVSAPAPVVAAVSPAALQQAIATCVQNANGNAAAIQACLSIASAAPAAPRDPFAIPPPSQVSVRP